MDARDRLKRETVTKGERRTKYLCDFLDMVFETVHGIPNLPDIEINIFSEFKDEASNVGAVAIGILHGLTDPRLFTLDPTRLHVRVVEVDTRIEDGNSQPGGGTSWTMFC